MKTEQSAPIEHRSNIILFGFMGAGKTTVGKELSSTYGFEFIETDSLVVEASAMTISDIFKVYGVEYFRKLEALAVKSVAERRGVVISTGGGVIENTANYISLTLNGIAFTLSAPFDALWERIKKDSIIRPLASSLDDLEKLYLCRKALYESVENSVSTENQDVSKIAATIYRQFLLLGGLAPLN